MVPVDECSSANNCRSSSGCTNVLVIGNDPLVVNANSTALVGVTAYIEAQCKCNVLTFEHCTASSCLNGGTCQQLDNTFKLVSCHTHAINWSHSRSAFYRSSYIHCVSKIDTGVAHYNFNAHQPSLVIFGKDVMQRICYQMVIWYPTSPNQCFSTIPGETWTRTPEIVSFQSCCISCLENDTALACYIFDLHQPILIIFCR